MLQLTSLSHAKHSNVVILYGAVFATLFAAERVSYLPEETICFPRNVVNETVRAREAPANWNIRFFHQVSRNRGESRTERRRSLPSIGDPLTLLPPRPITGRSLEYVARRRIDYRINRDTSAFQPALVISLHFIRYPYPLTRVIVLVSAALSVRCFKRSWGRRGREQRRLHREH